MRVSGACAPPFVPLVVCVYVHCIDEIGNRLEFRSKIVFHAWPALIYRAELSNM